MQTNVFMRISVELVSLFVIVTQIIAIKTMNVIAAFHLPPKLLHKTGTKQLGPLRLPQRPPALHPD